MDCQWPRWSCRRRAPKRRNNLGSGSVRIALATEDELSEAVGSRLVAEVAPALEINLRLRRVDLDISDPGCGTSMRWPDVSRSCSSPILIAHLVRQRLSRSGRVKYAATMGCCFGSLCTKSRPGFWPITKLSETCLVGARENYRIGRTQLRTQSALCLILREPHLVVSAQTCVPKKEQSRPRDLATIGLWLNGSTKNGAQNVHRPGRRVLHRTRLRIRELADRAAQAATQTDLPITAVRDR